MKLPPARWSPAALIELLTAKKQCKRIFHGNEWMKEHNYAFQNADTRPRLQLWTQNICFVISISAVILKRMVKITSIFGSYRFLKEQYPVTAHAPNFDFWTGCPEIKGCKESKRTLKNPFASRLAEFNTTLRLLRITNQWYFVPVKFRFGPNLDFWRYFYCRWPED